MECPKCNKQFKAGMWFNECPLCHEPWTGTTRKSFNSSQFEDEPPEPQGPPTRRQLKSVTQKNFKMANLVNKDFSNCDLSNANFQMANLTGCSFQNALLQNSNFKMANVTKCNFRGADLTGSNLKMSNFTHCNLDEANLTDVDFKMANI
jgi:uncharacterized protein YjbI with pentapeptide repeats